ncbi:hypothetical protein GA0074704_5446 [Micromonospora siamensis]|uniref:Uncharacterized protein n=1 Tax=Micromonospora siamensis TaxID=299152 RepID=A0A1C5K448_9ACTN|nr:hypothetical protein GA0074704_5446 [Micromonospora siamensis]
MLLWIGGLLAAGWWLFSIGMEQWAASYSPPDAASAELERRASRAGTTLVLVVAGGPLVIALVAYGMRLVRTAVVFLVLTLLLGGPALVLGAAANRDRQPPVPPPSAPGHCVELSGGDTRCPGG